MSPDEIEEYKKNVTFMWGTLGFPIERGTWVEVDMDGWVDRRFQIDDILYGVGWTGVAIYPDIAHISNPRRKIYRGGYASYIGQPYDPDLSMFDFSKNEEWRTKFQEGIADAIRKIRDPNYILTTQDAERET